MFAKIVELRRRGCLQCLQDVSDMWGILLGGDALLWEVHGRERSFHGQADAGRHRIPTRQVP